MPAIHPPTTHENVALTGNAGGALAGTYPNPTLRYPSGQFNVQEYGATGDGVTNDRAAIQSAVNAADAAGGGDVYFPSGTYVCLCTSGSSINLYDISNVRFVGHGKKSVVKMSASSDSNPVLFGNVGNGATGQTDIVFDSLSIDLPNVTNAIGISIGTSGSRITVRNCHFTGLKAGAIRPAGTDITIANNSFYGGSVGGYAILANNASTLRGLTIVNNVIDGNGGSGDGIELNQPSVAAASDIVIAGNLVHGYLTGSGSAGLGIAVAHCTDVTIIGNTIYDCYLDGIHVEDRSERISIVGNSVHNSKGYGISVQGVISDANINIGMVIANNIVSGVCVDRGDAGILLGGLYLSVDGFSVVGNQVHGVGRSGATNMNGISITGSKNGSVYGNTVRNSNGTNGNGLYLYSLEDVSVIGNRAHDDQGTPTQDYGIKVGGNMTRVMLFGNRLSDNGTGALDETNIGVASEYHKYANTGITPVTISGSRGGNSALADLLTKLSELGLISNSTT